MARCLSVYQEALSDLRVDEVATKRLFPRSHAGGEAMLVTLTKHYVTAQLT